MNVGSLFAGIGGFDLGLERAGMRTVWFCEQDPFCQRVLAKHWPGVPIHADVRALVANGDGSPADTHTAQGPSRQAASERGGVEPLSVRVSSVDVLCGGFPCQDLSYAGRGAGLDGDRSGLWGEYARLIRDLRPRYVVVENVSALLARGMGRVLGDLAACGYDAEWDCIPASAVGAPHRRDRVWLVAYPARDLSARAAPARPLGKRAGAGGEPGGTGAVANADFGGRDGWARQLGEGRRGEPTNSGAAMADAEGGGGGASGSQGGESRWPSGIGGGGERGPGDWWAAEPDVGRVAHGIPARVDRLRALGNALVPQIAEWIGHRILEHQQRTEEGQLAA